MRGLLFFSLFTVSVTHANAEIGFREHANGDLTIKVMQITQSGIAELSRDIPGDQGKCVRFQIMDYQQYGMSDSLMRIPAERHGIEFESHGDGVVRVVCGRFTEDSYDYSGNLESSLEYKEIEGY